MGMTAREWASAFLRRLGATPGEINIAMVVAWIQCENTSARFNPLATTQPWQGATVFNTAGVKNYPSVDDGLAATVATLNQNWAGYDRIRAALKDPNQQVTSSSGQTRAYWEIWGDVIGNSQWGTNGGCVAQQFARISERMRAGDRSWGDFVPPSLKEAMSNEEFAQVPSNVQIRPEDLAPFSGRQPVGSVTRKTVWQQYAECVQRVQQNPPGVNVSPTEGVKVSFPSLVPCPELLPRMLLDALLVLVGVLILAGLGYLIIGL